MSWLERIGALRPPPLNDAEGPLAFAPRRYDLVPPAPAAAPAPAWSALASSPLPPAAVIAARIATQAYRLGEAAPPAAERRPPAAPEPVAIAQAAVEPAPRTAPARRLTREELIADAMRHWRKGHAIFLRLDPALRDRVRDVAEQLAPK